MKKNALLLLLACGTWQPPPVPHITRVETHGDSILKGAYSDVASALGLALGNKYVVRDCAFGGQTVADCAERFDVCSSDPDVVVWGCGINDILQGGDGHTAATAAKAKLDEILDAGVEKVVVTTAGPCGGYATCHWPHNWEFNFDMRRWCRAQSPGRCEMAETSAELAAVDPYHLDDPCLVTTFFTDWLHPSEECTNLRYVPALVRAIEAQ